MKVAPSMLACNFSQMGNELIKIAKSGADLVHMDVMDGHFVPNISFGPAVIKSLRPLTALPFDVHLMISQPLKYISEFAICGADIITFHIESKSDPLKTIKKIRLLNKHVGISLKPSTDIAKILPFLPMVDVVLVMTVEPGFGGQSFMKNQLSKIEKIKNIVNKNGFKCSVQVDGGINLETAGLAKNAGADICVAGTSVFRAKNVNEIIRAMKSV